MYNTLVTKICFFKERGDFMKHIKSLNTRDLSVNLKKDGCGECQTSCQSACKTSCGIANQQCERLPNEQKEVKENS